MFRALDGTFFARKSCSERKFQSHPTVPPGRLIVLPEQDQTQTGAATLLASRMVTTMVFSMPMLDGRLVLGLPKKGVLWTG